MTELAVPWQLIALVEVPAIGALFGLVLRNARRHADLRVEIAEYKTHVAEHYVPFAALRQMEQDIKERLMSLEKKLDRILERRV